MIIFGDTLRLKRYVMRKLTFEYICIIHSTKREDIYHIVH